MSPSIKETTCVYMYVYINGYHIKDKARMKLISVPLACDLSFQNNFLDNPKHSRIIYLAVVTIVVSLQEEDKPPVTQEPAVLALY